jgi:hypothetical protein
VVALSTLSGTVEVDASGDTFQGHAVVMATGFDGVVLDQFEVDVIGTRIAVLEPGVPINASPVATPQS